MRRLGVWSVRGCRDLPSLGNLGVDYRVPQTWVQTPALSLTSHVASGRLLNVSEPQPSMCKLEAVTLRVTTRGP